jgi:hypothetical protein
LLPLSIADCPNISFEIPRTPPIAAISNNSNNNNNIVNKFHKSINLNLNLNEEDCHCDDSTSNNNINNNNMLSLTSSSQSSPSLSASSDSYLPPQLKPTTTTFIESSKGERVDPIQSKKNSLFWKNKVVFTIGPSIIIEPLANTNNNNKTKQKRKVLTGSPHQQETIVSLEIDASFNNHLASASSFPFDKKRSKKTTLINNSIINIWDLDSFNCLFSLLHEDAKTIRMMKYSLKGGQLFCSVGVDVDCNRSSIIIWQTNIITKLDNHDPYTKLERLEFDFLIKNITWISATQMTICPKNGGDDDVKSKLLLINITQQTNKKKGKNDFNVEIINNFEISSILFGL